LTESLILYRFQSERAENAKIRQPFQKAYHMNNPKSGKEEDQHFNMTGEQIRQERSRLKAEYGKLYDAVSEILFRYDPIGINFGHNTDEYEPEVRTILPRLNDCISVSHVRNVIHQEFVRWFDLDSAGPEARYEEIAEEVWAAWQNYQRDPVAGTATARVSKRMSHRSAACLRAR